MGLRNVPTSIKDPNLAGFLRELRAAVGGVSEQVTRLVQTRSTSGGGGGGDGGGGGGTDPGGGGGGGDPATPPAQTTVVLTIEPLRPTIGNPFTLTATVTGNQPTGRVQFRQNDSLMTLDSVELASGKASVTETIEEKDTYTFIAEYSGDPRNLSAVSNAVTVQFVSNWDGKPAAPSALTASADDPFQIFLKWYNPYIGDYAATEIWGVKQNPPAPSVAVDEADISGVAVKLGEVASTDYVLSQVDGVALDSGENWYFWVRNRDTEGLYSDWNAAAGTNGKTGIQPGKYLDILTGQITETQLYQDLGDKIDLIVPLGTRVDTVETDIVSLQNEDINLYAQLSLVSAGGTGFDTAKIWHFDSSSDITGWTVSNASALSVAGGLLTFTPTAANSSFSTTALSISGSGYAIVKARIKRTSGTEDTEWIGRLTYYYGSTSASLTISEPTYDANGWATAEWDLSGQAAWTGNTIVKLQFALGDAASSPWGGVFKVDWVAVGRNAPSASVAQVVDLAQAQIGYCLINGSASNHESKAACEAAGGTWLGNYPLAQSVKQVSVTDGVSTGTIEQKFTAQKVTTDGLRLQYTVKIDNQGFVSGFGLASDPVNGKPYSDFMVRADRFSISSPTIPTWQKSVSSLTHNGTVATVTTSSAHGYSTGQYVMLANIADGYWNRTFKITATPTTTTFQVACSASEPLSLNPAAVSPGVAATGLSIYCSRVIIPFIVTTTPTVENGITIPPGVYIDSAHVKDATITEAKIRDAAITNAKIGGFIETAGWTGQAGPAGWRLDKNNSTVEIKGGFALYDTDGSPIITAGRINVQQFRRLILAAQPAEVFTLAKNTGAVSPSAISLVATLQNIVTTGSTASVIWTVTQGTYDGKTVGQTVKTDTGITANTSLSVDPAKFGAGVTVVGFKVACTFGGTTYEDTFTIPKLAEGTDALYLHLTNESDSLNTNADGTFAFGANKISTSGVVVYRGSTNATGETSPAWTITATSNDANTTASYASGTVTVTMQNSSADRVLVTVTATRGSETATKVMTVVKAKQGSTGSAYTVVLTNEASIVPFTGGVGSYTDTPTTVLVYSGSTQLGTSSATEWFQITSAIGSGITAGGISGANIGAASNITASSATITITIAIKDSSGATKATITKVQSITKSTEGKSLSLGATGYVVNVKDANTVPQPTRILLTATAQNLASGTSLQWSYRITTGGVTGAWTAIALTNPYSWDTDPGTVNPSFRTAFNYVEWRVQQDGLTDTITVVYVKDGATGIDGRRGGVSAYIATFSAAAAWNAIVAAAGSNPVPGDFVETESGSRYGYVSGGYPGSWTSGQSVAFSGNVIVQGTLAANKLAAGEIGSHLIKLGAYENDPNAIIQSNGFNSGVAGWRIRGNGDAEFNTVIVRSGANVSANALAKTVVVNPQTIYNTTNDASPWRLKGVFTAGGLTDYFINMRASNNASWPAFGEEVFWVPQIDTLPFAAGRTTNIVVTVTFEVPGTGGLADGVICQCYCSKYFSGDAFGGTGYKGAFIDSAGSATGSWVWNGSQHVSSTVLPNEIYARKTNSGWINVNTQIFSASAIYSLAIPSNWNMANAPYRFFIFRIRARHDGPSISRPYYNPRIVVQATVE